MNHYIEVTLIDTPDFPIYQLWSTCCMQLHIAFAEIKNEDEKVNIGISFPEYHYHPEKGIRFLGTKLRLFSQFKETLVCFNILKWLERLSNHVYISCIQEVPKDKVVGYAIYQRKQVKTNAERLARRRAKCGDITFEEALKRYTPLIKTTDLPYIQINSLTTKKRFKLFIEKRAVKNCEHHLFSTYGLSPIASVPEF